ncbi:MAG: radical SAM protein [Candidatus Makaraimicrobium thalassicum]|nr:MAG: radical SAM protein [Candidatus Omnitrophota bacterium]
MSEKSRKEYKYIYGPVPSWRLGSSLGIDPISGEGKICSFDCVYCQLGRTVLHTKRRKVFVPVSKIIKEIRSLPPVKIDYMTFSGTGEPTSAKNLGKMIKAVKRIRKEPVAVLTNSSLMYRKDVRKDLSLADVVIAKLDASSERTFRRINQPVEGMKLADIVRAIKKFKTGYKGKLVLQIMFMEENRGYAGRIAQIAKEIGPYEVQLNTPLRPSVVEPLSRKKMIEVGRYFKGMNVISVYKSPRKRVKPISGEDTMRRRGKV